MSQEAPLKIVLTADPEVPVPPLHYGGIERVIDSLARGLESRGHEVTLFAHEDSRTSGRLVPWQGRSSRRWLDTWRNSRALSSYISEHACDVIHSFSRVIYMLPMLHRPVPKLMTYQRPVSPRSIRFGHHLSAGSLEFSGMTDRMIAEVRHLARWHIVPNCVSPATFEFQPEVDDDAPLVFLGRIEEIKGTHLAIEIARKTHRKLVIAGNIPDGKESWFEQHVAPHIDGSRITYVGPVDDTAKNQLLGQAAAFLMPILWEEPFGIVMAEAMCCGTPVLGLDRGAVSEVVEDGVTGYVRNTIDELADTVAMLPQINRHACRQRVERLFSEDVVVESYLQIYRQMLVKKRGESV